jgi:hypothetical protein
VSITDEVYRAVVESGSNAVMGTGSDGSPTIVLRVPQAAPNAPELVMFCTRDGGKVVFTGRCPLQIPRDRYWDALAYVNAAVTDTAFARMYLDGDYLRFQSFLMADGRSAPANVGMMAMLFVMEASTLSMASKYIVESLMKPDEAVKHAMTMMREQARSGLG